MVARPGYVWDGAQWVLITNTHHTHEHTPLSTARIYSVLEYGAVGDGVADDTAEIQAAITAAAGSVVYFPPGVYKTSAALMVPSGTTLLGSGWKSVIKSVSLDNGGFSIGHRQVDGSGATDWAVKDLAFDASGMTSFAAGMRCILAQGSSHYRVEGCRFKTPGAAVASIGSHHYWLDGNYSEWSALDGISHHDGALDQWGGCHDFAVIGNKLRLGGITPYGVIVTGEDTSNLAAACYNAVISDNTINDAYGVGIWTNGRKGGNHDITITGNVVRHTEGYYGIAASDTERFTITGNTIHECGLTGIRMYSETSAGGTLAAVDGTVSGNVIVDANLLNNIQPNLGSGIATYGACDSILVTGNQVSGSHHIKEVHFEATSTNCRAITGDNVFSGEVNFGSGDATNTATVQKPAGDLRIAPINWIHDATYGDLLHLTSGPNSGGTWALIGLGVDYGDMRGLYVSNKSSNSGAEGIHLVNTPTSTGKGFKGRQQSSGDLMHLQQQAGTSGHILRLETDTSATGKVLTVRDALDNEYLYIGSDRLLRITHPTGNGDIKFQVNGTAQRQTFDSYSGAAGVFWSFDIDVNANQLDLRSSASSGAKGSHTMQKVISILDNQRLGFYGATPVAKPAVTGSRGGNAALASLLTQLASLGLVTDSSSA